jgi:SAM-dependent methyltransferase
MPDLFKRKTCRLCDGSKLELVVPIPPTAIADAYVPAQRISEVQPTYPLDLYFCGTCAHVQLLDVVSPELMFRDAYTYQSGSSAGIVKHFQEYADGVLAREKPAAGSLVIDIGSNDGTLLRCFKKAGMTVLGIDPATDLARAATASGIETLPSFLNAELAQKIRKERGAARIVTANNVFAHADDLAGMADSIRTLLANDGVFVFEVSYLVDVVEKMLLGTIFHEHLSYHSVKPMAAFLARHGMELVAIEQVGIQGGSLIGTAQLRGGPRPVSPHVEELIRREAAQGYHHAETLRQFARRLEQMKQDLGALIGGARERGQVIAGFGASRGGTTLLYKLDIGRHLDFIADDSPAKQGLYSPGHHIPIVPGSALYERKPAYVFLLAWVHAKAIMKNHQRYLDEGGRFIVAYPRVEVLSKGASPSPA